MSLGGADRVIIGSKKEKLINGFFYYISSELIKPDKAFVLSQCKLENTRLPRIQKLCQRRHLKRRDGFYKRLSQFNNKTTTL